MSTLIASYGSSGCNGRCDAKCYDAMTPGCECICGGKNHGAGLAMAAKNTRELAGEWMEAWQSGHKDTVRFDVPVRQGRLF